MTVLAERPTLDTVDVNATEARMDALDAAYDLREAERMASRDYVVPAHVRVPDCPAWCQSTGLWGDPIEGHDFHPDCMHSGIVGTVTLDGQAYALSVNATEDHEIYPRVEILPVLSLIGDGPRESMTGAELAEHIPTLVQAYTAMLHELAATATAWQPMTDEERAALEAEHAANRAAAVEYEEARKARAAEYAAKVRAEYVDVDSCPTCGHLPCCAEHYIPHAPNTVPLYGPVG